MSKQQKTTHPCLTEALIVTSPLDTSIPAAEAWETTNADAFSVAPVVADIRNAPALQWWSWNAPPSMIQAVTAITSPPQENFEENIPAQTWIVFHTRLYLCSTVAKLICKSQKDFDCLWTLEVNACNGGTRRTVVDTHFSAGLFQVGGQHCLWCHCQELHSCKIEADWCCATATEERAQKWKLWLKTCTSPYRQETAPRPPAVLRLKVEI